MKHEPRCGAPRRARRPAAGAVLPAIGLVAVLLASATGAGRADAAPGAAAGNDRRPAAAGAAAGNDRSPRAAANGDSAHTHPVLSLIEQGTSVAERARAFAESSEDITAERFWTPEPLGFDRQALAEVWDLLIGLPHRLPEIAAGARQRAGALGLFTALTAAALVLTLLLRRRLSVRVARELGQTLLPLRSRVPHLVSRWIVSLVRFVSFILAPLAVLAVYYLARNLSGLGDPWFRGLGDLLLGLAILAAALGVLHELLLGGLLPLQKENGRRLYGDLRRTALIGFLGLVAVALAERAGAPDSVLALGRFAVRLAVLCLATLALRDRHAVLDLFPAFENRAYQAFLRWLGRFYSAAIFLTFCVLLLGLFGYRRLSSFLLVRSWVLVGIFVLTVGLHSGVLKLLRRWILGDGGRSLEAFGFYRSSVLLVTYVTGIALGTLFLNLLGVLAPISRLLATPLATVGEQDISLLLLVEAIATILIFVFAGRLICKYLDFQVYPALHVDPGVSTAINTMVMWVLVGIGMIVSLDIVGLNLRVLSLFAGALGLGIGFGLQNFAKNIVSGMTLIFGRNLRRGDFVTVGDNAGFVQQVGIRVTRIRTRDAIEYTIPNSAFLENMIINWSHTSPLVRTHVPVGVSYDADPQQVREVLLEVANKTPAVEQSPPPDVWFVGYGESSIDFELLVWLNVRRVAQEEVASQVLFAAFEALGAHGIEIPYPQRDLHIRSGLPAVGVTGAGAATGAGEVRAGAAKGEAAGAAKGEAAGTAPGPGAGAAQGETPGPAGGGE